MNNLLLKSILLSSTLLSFNTMASPLTKLELNDLFASKTASCIKTKDQSTCLTYMGFDGSVKRLTHKDGKTRLGSWYSSEDNQLCIRWANKNKALCFDVIKNEDNTYNLDRKGKTKSVITGFKAGNLLK